MLFLFSWLSHGSLFSLIDCSALSFYCSILSLVFHDCISILYCQHINAQNKMHTLLSCSYKGLVLVFVYIYGVYHQLGLGFEVSKGRGVSRKIFERERSPRVSKIFPETHKILKTFSKTFILTSLPQVTHSIESPCLLHFLFCSFPSFPWSIHGDFNQILSFCSKTNLGLV